MTKDDLYFCESMCTKDSCKGCEVPAFFEFLKSIGWEVKEVKHDKSL